MPKAFKSKNAKTAFLIYIALPMLYITYKYVKYKLAVKNKTFEGSFPKYCFGTIFNLA